MIACICPLIARNGSNKFMRVPDVDAKLELVFRIINQMPSPIDCGTAYQDQEPSSSKAIPGMDQVEPVSRIELEDLPYEITQAILR